jgi:predicted kinase
MTLILLGGPAGAGKSTLARAWCATRPQAAHIELDAVRGLVVSGLADPQQQGRLQEAQYRTSVEATCALAGAFVQAGCDVAIDDVLEPGAFDRHWRPALAGLEWRLAIIVPSLEETLDRSARREKRVLEEHTRSQHVACSAWGAELRLDTTGLTVERSLALLETLLERTGPTAPRSD